MKKLTAFLAIILLAVFIISACTKNISESGQISTVESTKTIANSSKPNESIIENSTIDKAKIKELESEIDKLNALLSDTNSENEVLANQIKNMEEDEDYLKYWPAKVRFIMVKNGMYIKIKKDNGPSLSYTVTIEYDDKPAVEVIKIRRVWTIKASPEGTKIILNDFTGEYNAKVFMHDVEKKETKELKMPNLPRDTTVSSMEWLDDRYFLFVVQRDHGSVVRGGDAYVYDTKNNEYKAIIKNSDWKYQTYSFNVFSEDFVVINSWLYEETMNFAEKKHYIMTFDEVYDLMKNNKTLDLSKKK